MPIGSDVNRSLIRGSERSLWGLSVGKTLAPKIRVSANLSGEIHPVPARGPRRGKTRTRGPDGTARRAAVERHEATTPIGRSVHLYNQHAFSIWRQIGIVRHAAFVTWQIDFAVLGAIVERGDDPQMQTGLEFGVHHRVDPDKHQA